METQQDIRPAYEVEKLRGKRKRVYHSVRFKTVEAGFDEEGNAVTKKMPEAIQHEKEVDAGYIVYTAKGDAIHVWDRDDLIKYGIRPEDGQGPLVDMVSGEMVEVQKPLSLKERVMLNAARNF